MSYSCSDFTDTILDALNVDVPDRYADSPSKQADLALAAIDKLRARVETLETTLRFAAELVPIARKYFPKKVSDADKFKLELTCADIGAALKGVK